MLAISTKLATGVYGSNNKTEVIEKHDLEVGEGCLNVTKETDLEIVPTNQQDEVNIENCLKITNKSKNWWPWLRQKQGSKPSEEGKPTIHSLTNDDCEVISMLEVIERKVATFKPKISSLELLHQEMAKRIIKVEMDKDMTVINEKLAKLEKEISQVAKENVKITTFQQEIPNLKPDSYYLQGVH